MKLEEINNEADLEGYLAEVVDWLNQLHPDERAFDACIQKWEDIRGITRALGRKDKLGPYGGPIERPTWVIKYEILETEIRDQLRGRVDFLLEGIKPRRTADSKTDSEKNSYEGTPENPDVIKLALRIRRNADPKRRKTDIAREFTNNNEKRAQSLLRKLRSYPHLLNGADTADG